MKTQAIVALAVASALLSPIVGAKEVKRSDLFESTFSVGNKTRDAGSGINLDADWLFSQNVGIYGSVHSVSGDDVFDTDATLQRYGLDGEIPETLFPRRFSFDRTHIEYGMSLRHVFYDALETPFAIYVKVGVVDFQYDEVEFLTADASDSQDSSGGDSSDSGGGSSNEPSVDEVVVLALPGTEAIKASIGTKFFINNRTTFDVSYAQYEVSSNVRRQESSESSVDVEVAYFPRKNFGVSFMYESSDVTGDPTYNIQATVRW